MVFIEYIGKIIEISMSKIKNIIAIIKKWVEKGFRAEFIDENPHSNGEFFSRLNFLFLEIVEVIMNVIIRIINNVNEVYNNFIIFLKI